MSTNGKPAPAPLAGATPRRRIRSFVKRSGRMTPAQQRAINRLWPVFGVELHGETLDPVQVFAAHGPVVLDIGFGDGEALLELAGANPNVNYLGVEVYEPGIGHLLLGLDAAQIGNVRIIQGDAAELLDERLHPGSLAAVNLLFPDPWPKKRHFKRRLLQPAFVEDVCQALQPGGLLHFATDWLPYAEHAEQLLAGVSPLRQLTAAQVANDPLAQRPQTKFERRGLALGHPVTDLYYRRL